VTIRLACLGFCIPSLFKPASSWAGCLDRTVDRLGHWGQYRSPNRLRLPSREVQSLHKSLAAVQEPSQVRNRSFLVLAGCLTMPIGIARTASSLRQSFPLAPSSSNLASLPAHLRNLSTPRIPSPLGKGTPARGVKQSLPVRTSKTTERHVFLPEDPQLAPLPVSPRSSQIDLVPPPRPIPGPSRGHTQDERSDAEKMTKREREENRIPRLTAYATAEAYRLKFLQAFLKREHGVGVVRVFDDCLYAVGHIITAVA